MTIVTDFTRVIIRYSNNRFWQMYYIVGEQFLKFRKDTVKECLINTWYNPVIKIDNISVFKGKDLFQLGSIYIWDLYEKDK